MSKVSLTNKRYFCRCRAKFKLDEGVKAALAQIAEKEYSEDLQHRGIPADRIHAFGIAFSGKDVLVGGA